MAADLRRRRGGALIAGLAWQLVIVNREGIVRERRLVTIAAKRAGKNRVHRWIVESSTEVPHTSIWADSRLGER